jgi:hypothetical protein
MTPLLRGAARGPAGMNAATAARRERRKTGRSILVMMHMRVKLGYVCMRSSLGSPERHTKA